MTSAESQVTQNLSIPCPVSRKIGFRHSFFSVSAPAPCDGAFVFLETNTNRFYVQGLVDGITPSTDDPPLFTNTFVDLTAHIDWMNAVRKANEDRLVNNEVRLEAEATDASEVCAKDNDLQDLDVRFANEKERRSEMDSG